MKLDLLDAYNIRARLSASIILLAPIAITIFLCFEETTSVTSSSVLLVVLLAFTNYIPILQRRIYEDRIPYTNYNYASLFLTKDDATLDPVSKERYYRVLAKIDPTFAPFEHPDDSETFRRCCDSAVIYLRHRTRGNHLVQEENINYGFCRNLLANKAVGIILCITFGGITAAYSWLKYETFYAVPVQNYLALAANFLLLLFWIFGVTKQMLKSTAVKYAKTLLSAIDSFDNIK